MVSPGLVASSLLVLLGACGDNTKPPIEGHGPIAEGVSAPLGEPWPSATPEQLASFERGVAVMGKRFSRSEGLGPAFNVTFCAGCHEKPVFGGGAGHYRNFFIVGQEFEDNFFPANKVSFLCGDSDIAPEERILLPKEQYDPPYESREGVIDGVVRMYFYGEDNSARPAPYSANPESEDPDTFDPPPINVVAQRNPIPFFGVGLIAQLSAAEIISRADPEDKDGDGISGRAHLLAGRDTTGDGAVDTFDVGRFGVKAQTTSIEGFIRGPLFNHLGITSDPLTEEQRSRLPIDSSSQGLDETASLLHGAILKQYAQAVAPSGPNCDIDEALDPELDPELLFDLVSASMLMAAPLFDEDTPQIVRGRDLFDDVGCADCHAPRLSSPRGPIPVYSDMLLHDMGPGLDDGLEFGEAATFEFRTQPLWGVAATGPYLHDGRAVTLEEAITWHGGEAVRSRDAYVALSPEGKEDLLEFLMSLGGRDQATGGLLLPEQPVPEPGTSGGPRAGLSADEAQRFSEGRSQFDREHGPKDGLGGPRLNGDSCRACHFEPAIGGAGPRGTNVMRHGVASASGDFVMPQVGTSVLHKSTVLFDGSANFPQVDAEIFEHRQSPSLFGVGRIDGIADPTIAANADPNDDNGDGISGRLSITDGGQIGKFGWKAQVPSLAEFVRDAVTVELGMTLPAQEGLTFGKIHDNDSVADPEMGLDEAASLLFFMSTLAAPSRNTSGDADAMARGENLFAAVGCASCHMPTLEGADGPVGLYSDLLLHEVLPVGHLGIEDASANMREFRTAPLWGIGETGPYLHDGSADTLQQAIEAHAGEAEASALLFESLLANQKEDLLAFLKSL